jgi:hypothetical protein
MGKFAECVAATVSLQGGRCKIPMVRAAMDAEDVVDFDAALASEMTAAQLSRIIALMTPEHRTSAEAIMKHRTNVCSCGAMAAKGAL